MNNTLMAAVLTLAVAVVPVAAHGTRHQTATKTITDQQFVMNAANGNQAEIELGNLVVSKASNDQVKSFARRMVDDHQKALDNLKTVAKNHDITLGTTLDPKNQALKTRLESLSGVAFDRAYMRAMVRDHHQDVTEFRAEAKAAKASDIRQFASSTLPTLEDHLKQAESVAQAIGATTTEKRKTS